MKFVVLVWALLLNTLLLNAQTSYVKTYGNKKNKPVIFLHGGPGSNAGGFEVTTARKLADNGYYVILYDRRGEGRSVDTTARYTFQQSFDDLNNLYKRFGIKKATLIGYSFGGLLATLYTEKNSDKVSSLVLISSLLSLQDTYSTILKRSEDVFRSQNDTANLNKLQQVALMDRSSIEFRANCFSFATLNKFFDTPHPNELSVQLNKRIEADSVLMRLRADTSNPASVGFWRNEKYTTIDIFPKFQSIQDKHINIYAVYGKDDGLFSEQQVAKVKTQIGDTHVKYWDNCSHGVYIDQQTAFLQAIKGWIK